MFYVNLTFMLFLHNLYCAKSSCVWKKSKQSRKFCLEFGKQIAALKLKKMWTQCRTYDDVNLKK